jgi:MFS family permease
MRAVRGRLVPHSFSSFRFPHWSAPEIAIALLFATNGFLFGGWIVRIPAIINRLDISTGTFGLILPAGAIGAMLALPVAGKLAGIQGSARLTIFMSLLRSLVVPLMILVPHPLWFAAGLFCYGFTNGAMDVALNAQGVEVERAGRRSILSTLHGCSSLGALAGSVFGGLAAGFGIGIVPQLFATCAGIAILTLAAMRHLVPDEAITLVSDRPRKRFLLPPKALLPFGVIALCSVIGEGGTGDWSALYLRNELGTSASFAAYGYTAFATFMLLGRFLGDRAVRRFGEERSIRGGSLIASTGLLGAAAVGTLWSGMIGFALAGFGLSIIIPTIYRMAGNTPGVPRAQAVASTALIAYLGFLIGPLVLGTIGNVFSIRISIIVIALVVLSTQLIAGVLRQSNATPSAEPIHTVPPAGIIEQAA